MNQIPGAQDFRASGILIRGRKVNRMKEITNADFLKYGRIIEKIDSSEICKYMQKYSNTSGVTYLASDAQMEQMAIAQHLTDDVFGEMPLQIGACFGANRRMDAMEYHNCSEVNIAATDMILFLGLRQDIAKDWTYETAKAEQFFVPTGTVFEMYATTLHYAPCGVNGEQFRSVIVLPRGTNTALDGIHEDKMLVAKNKWLIGHPQAELPAGTWLGLRGENHGV